MRRGTLIALLCMTALVLASGNKNNDKDHNNKNKNFGSDEDDNSQEFGDNNNRRLKNAAQLKPFRAGNEYTFTYNTQVATGLVPAETSGEPGMPQQKAITRMQALAHIHFESDRHATLQLDQIRMGQLNDPIPQPDRVKPMRMFQPKQIPQDKYRQLELPVQFIYADGVIERVVFHTQEETWTKNIKRAVLNMIQLNLSKNNAQGLRLPEELSGQRRMDNDDEDNSERGLSFTLPEITIEGECQTMYTVQQREQAAGNNGNNRRFNVTKSINFKQCRKIADVSYGYQTQEEQSECAQCSLQWYKQQQLDASNNGNGNQQQQQHPCERCDPKEVREQKLSRSTVQRCVLQGPEGSNGKQHAIERCELTSQYVYRNLNAETGEYGSAMQAIVASEMVFREAQQKSSSNANAQQQQQRPSSEKDETLLFSPQWDVTEKRFYMYGDEEYARNSPFKEVQNKVQQAEQALRKLCQTANNKEHGIEIEAPIQMQRLVETMRMCSFEELKQIDRAVSSGRNQQQSEEKQMAEQFFTDALAIAGTRNCIAYLVEKILEKQLTTAKAVQALKSLQGLPAPSDSQVQMVKRLCQSEVCQRSAALKQACWLTFGAIVNEACARKTEKVPQQALIFGSQSGFTSPEICPGDKKQQYCDALLAEYRNADTVYDKVLSLKALGNAGLDCSITDLEAIITGNNAASNNDANSNNNDNDEEQRIVRAVAIDALRRLRRQMPRKIQNMLMPVFLNTRETAELRTAAFAQLMNTLPSQQLIDQVAYALTKERSQHVRAFVYNTLKSIAKTQNPAQREMAKHIENALKLVTVDDQELKMCGRTQIPIYSEEQNEGVFVNLISACSARSPFPAHVSAQLNSVLNNEFQTNDVSVSISQQDIEQWFEQFHHSMFQQGQYFNNNNNKDSPTRAQRSLQQQSNNGQTLRNIYSALGIKPRRSQQSNYNKGQPEPFAMLNIRIRDIDQAIFAISEEQQRDTSSSAFSNILRKAMLSRDKQAMMAQILAVATGSDSRYKRKAMATNFAEKRACIPTSSGLPLKLQHSAPVIFAGEAQAQLMPAAQKIHLQAQIAMNAAHIQKLECWMPIFATGVQSIRSLELNVPVNVQLGAANGNGDKNGGVQFRIQVPQNKKVQVLGLHTLPTTYTADFDQQKNTLREPKIKALHNQQIEECQREVRTVLGQSVGLQFHAKGHFCRPSQPINYRQLVQLLMASENQMHIEFEPAPQTPREVVIEIEGDHFQKTTSEAPQFQQFYEQSNNNQFYENSEDDFENMESHSERRQKLQKSLGQYQSSQAYKHGLRISAHTVGSGQRESRAQMSVQAQCDARFKSCQASLNVERQTLSDNGAKWTMNAQARFIRPDTVNSVSEFDQQQQQQQNKFIAQAECEWGQQNGGGNKQHVNIRIQGEHALRPQWRQQQKQAENSASANYYRKQTTFVNKYDIVADYKLGPKAQNVCKRLFEALKARNFWNTQTLPLQQQNSQQQQGRVQAQVVIDPITQKHCNVTVQTPAETVRIDSMELPIHSRPFPLIRASPEREIHSAGQLFQRWNVAKRAECSVDGRRVESFDNAEFRAPITKCYNVLAKDCSGRSEDPQFVVMMKCLGNNNDNCNSDSPKKIKVITPEQVVECQPKNPQEQQRGKEEKLVCKVNGQTVTGDNNDNSQKDYTEQGTVECNNRQCTECTINVRGVSVRFNGRKAWIKISSQYKNGQCGLCGHYDDNANNEWRMADNEQTGDLARFHRSYSLLHDDECSAQEQNDFYANAKSMFKKNAQKASFRRSSSIGSTSSSSSESNENYNNDDEENNGNYGESRRQWNINNEDDQESFEDDDESWFGRPRRNNNNNNNNNKSWNRNNNNNQKKNKGCDSSGNCKPEEQTAVMEVGSSKVCFSMEPVKQCPAGTFPVNKNSRSTKNNKASSFENDDFYNNNEAHSKKVQFACLPRSSETRQLLAKARRGDILNMDNYQASLTEQVQQPQQCAVY